MIKIGTDIAEIERFSQMENIEAFTKRVFTERERKYFATFKNPVNSIAGSFAAKEAFSKYLGSGVRGFGFSDIEVLHNEAGKPYICFKGREIAADVSISHSETSAVAVVCGEEFAIDEERINLLKSYAELLPKRRPNMNKGDCGKVFVVAGSVGMVGAACLCAKSSMRSGSGLVTLGTPQCVQPQVAVKLDEVMTMPLPCRDGKLCVDATEQIIEKAKKSDVCAIGPGLGRCDDIKEIIKALLKETTPMVIDADGLNAISDDMGVLKSKSCPVVMTPHPGEMARLTGLSIEEVEKDRVGTAARLAKECSTVVVLKGRRTVVVSPDGEAHINESGNSGMASGGMGDVLTGIIASLIGQGKNPYDAAVLGVFIHGLSGDMAANEIGEFGLVAGDVAEKLPYAIKTLADRI